MKKVPFGIYKVNSEKEAHLVYDFFRENTTYDICPGMFEHPMRYPYIVYKSGADTVYGYVKHPHEIGDLKSLQSLDTNTLVDCIETNVMSI